MAKKKKKKHDPKRATKTKSNSNGIPSRASRWDDFYYVTIYLLASDGFTDRAIAQAIGVSPNTFTKWKQKRPAILKALKFARSGDAEKTTGITLQDFVYQRLSPELLELWKKITNLFEAEPNAVVRIENLLKDAGNRARQHLFLHALINSNFNTSEACRRVNISRNTVAGWVRKEPEFEELMDEMLDHQRSFCMGAYMQLVEFLEPSVVLHSARTLNRETFGSEKQVVEVEGTVHHTHDHLVSIADLDLSVEVRKEILNAIRKQKEKVIEVEPTNPTPAFRGRKIK